jgi:hypothetical protein
MFVVLSATLAAFQVPQQQKPVSPHWWEDSSIIMSRTSADYQQAELFLLLVKSMHCLKNSISI